MLRGILLKIEVAVIGGVILWGYASMFSSLIGLLLSFHYSLPSGPAIILVAGVGYGLSLIFGPVGGAIAQNLPRRKFET